MVDTDEITTGRDYEGSLASLQWTTPDNWTAKLHRIELSEVVAVVLLRDPEATLA